ncbi:MAG: hypothetical protein ABI472_03485 [Ginsengibacter sp.]
MTKKKILFTAIVMLIIVAGGVVYHEYNRSSPDVASLDAKPVTAENLFKDFQTNEQGANKMYLNRPLEVSGKVLEVKQNQDEPSQIILDCGDPFFGVACTLDKLQKSVHPGSLVTVKGICTGYLNDVIIIKSLLLNQKL